MKDGNDTNGKLVRCVLGTGSSKSMLPPLIQKAICAI